MLDFTVGDLLNPSEGLGLQKGDAVELHFDQEQERHAVEAETA
ncbi:hypothetical protein [Streptomyces broussonetiae]|nr:hypothetical protein [Streptomyces broussonetiae]